MAREGTTRPAARLTVTDVAGIEHLVTDEAMAAGRPTGRYTAACGDEILAGSLTAPESSRCKPSRRRAGK
jgi:hypothetical protein